MKKSRVSRTITECESRLKAEADRIEQNLEAAMQDQQEGQGEDDEELTEEQLEQKKQELEEARNIQQKLLGGLAAEDDPKKPRSTKRKKGTTKVGGGPAGEGTSTSTSAPGPHCLLDDFDTASVASGSKAKGGKGPYDDFDPDMLKVAAVHEAEAEKTGKNASVKCLALLRVENFFGPKSDRTKTNTLASVGCPKITKQVKGHLSFAFTFYSLQRKLRKSLRCREKAEKATFC